MEVLLFAEVVANLVPTDEEDVKWAIRCLRNMTVDIGKDITLDKLQRYSLLKFVWRSPYYTLEEK
jgi:hypothetical protein